MTDDILDRLKRAEPLARGPYRSLIEDAIIKIERQQIECMKLAHLLMSGLVFVHESKITEVDRALAPYLGDENKWLKHST